MKKIIISSILSMAALTATAQTYELTVPRNGNLFVASIYRWGVSLLTVVL